MLCVRLWTLRRRYCSASSAHLIILVAAVFLFYQSLMGGWSLLTSEQTGTHNNKNPASGVEKLEVDGIFVSTLENLEREWEQAQGSNRKQALVLMGQQHIVTNTEVQLYLRVLEETGHDVSLSRYAERSAILKSRKGSSQWSVLVCLRTSERSCLWSIPFADLHPYQMVNMIPELLQAFSDAGTGLCQFYTHTPLAGDQLPMKPFACGPTNRLEAGFGRDSERPMIKPSALSPGLTATVNVYVLVTSAISLTAFLHEKCLATTGEELHAQSTELRTFLHKHLGPTASQEALGHVKEAIGQVLRAAMWTSQENDAPNRCLLCYQLLTFTLHFTGSLLPTVVKIDRDLSFAGLKDPAFDGLITREIILEDTLRFLLPVLHVPEGVYPSSVSGGWPHPHQQQHLPRADGMGDIQMLQLKLALYYEVQRNHTYRSNEESLTNQQTSQESETHLKEREHCHLRQLYTDPPLSLTPAFSPQVKVYSAEVPFDTLSVRIRPEPISPACQAHLDELGGPRTANYPVGLGDSQINILVLDEAMLEAEPVAMVIYTLHLHRESHPSLPMFGDHVMCSFLQDCGMVLQPEKPCGLEPFPRPPEPIPLPCVSGAIPGRWVVPCLSCADNRTCDWREIAWHPEDCYHPVVDYWRLRDCMADRRLLFIGDSTNRGMMYFLMERVNFTLEDWGKAHDTLFYSNLNQGRTHVSYTYYPQFWLEKRARPTFKQSLEQLIFRSQPLSNSHRTALVVGGVQWLNTVHLRIIRQVLEREGLGNIMVVIKSLGIGFHLPTDGIRSLTLRELQQLYQENGDIIVAAKRLKYDVVDTFHITMGRYKDFMPGHCACHFHKVEKLSKITARGRSKEASRYRAISTTNQDTGVGLSRDGTRAKGGSEPHNISVFLSSSYHVRGPVNQVYSEILLSRLCPTRRGN